MRRGFALEDVDRDGDCFYRALFLHFERFLPFAAADRRHPTSEEIGRLRDKLASRVEQAFNEYNKHPDDNPSPIVQNFARAWGTEWGRDQRLWAQKKHLKNIRKIGDYMRSVRPRTEPTGSAAVAAAALLWNLPLTVLDPWNPIHIGPHESAPIGYLYYTGGHNMGVDSGNKPIKRAAELLQVKPTTLHEMMKRLNISSESLVST